MLFSLAFSFKFSSFIQLHLHEMELKLVLVVFCVALNCGNFVFGAVTKNDNRKVRK